MKPDDTQNPTDGWTRLCEGVLRTNFGRIESNAVAGAMKALSLEEARRQEWSRRWILRIAALLVLGGIISWGISTRWQNLNLKDEPPAPTVTSQPVTPAPAVAPSGSILLEIWRDVPGDTIASLTNSAKFNQTADEVRALPSLEIRSISAVNLGNRIRGWLNPEVSGAYEFWIASDDASEFWLSPDADAERRQLVARVDGWTTERAWDFNPSQRSNPMLLEAGRRYYFEALHKQGGAAGHLSIAWSTAGRPREVVDRKYVTPFQLDSPR